MKKIIAIICSLFLISSLFAIDGKKIDASSLVEQKEISIPIKNKSNNDLKFWLAKESHKRDITEVVEYIVPANSEVTLDYSTELELFENVFFVWHCSDGSYCSGNTNFWITADVIVDKNMNLTYKQNNQRKSFHKSLGRVEE